LISETEELRQKALEELQAFRKNLEDFVAEHKDIFSNSLPNLSIG